MANAEARPPSTEAPVTPSLPLELIAAIVEEAITTQLEAHEAAQAAELCLLCKALLPYARGALYRTVHLFGPLVEDPFDDEVERLGFEEAVRPHSSNLKLLDSLDAAPYLARLVVELRVHDRKLDKDDDDESLMVQYDLDRIWQACTNIRAVQEYDSAGSYWRSYSKALEGSAQVQQLRTIKFHWFNMEPTDVYSLQDAHALQHLSMGESCPAGQATPAPPPTFRLASFAIHLTSELPTTLDFWLSQSSSSLRRLTIPRSPPQPDLTRFKSLEDLTFVVTPDRGAQATLRQLFKTIESVSSTLITLRLAIAPSYFLQYAIDEHAVRTVKQDEREGDLTRLPSMVQHLDVRTLPYSTASLLAYLDSEVSPCLRRLDIMRPTIDKEHLELQEACWGRGVELYSYCGREESQWVF